MSFKLEEVAEFQKGFAFKSKTFKNKGVKVVKVSNLSDDSINPENCVHVDVELALGSQKYSLNENDIIITTVGSWPTNPASIVGKVVKVQKNMQGALLNQNAVRVRAKEGTDQKFLFYLLKDKSFRNYIIGTAQGSANQASITQNDIKNYKYSFPNLTTQKSIANILSSLDEKIETNNEINKKLEEMAQAIFKQWFVDFEFPNENGEPYKSSGGAMVESELGMIPEGWEIKKLNEIINFIKNPTKSGEHLKDRAYIPIDTMPMKSVVTNAFKSYEEAKSSLVLFEKHDILIGAMRVYFHRVNLASQKGVTRTTTFVLRSKNLIDISYNLFLINQDSTIEFANSTSRGSTMPYAVWDGGLGTMSLCYPNQKIREQYNHIVFPLLNKMMDNSRENQLLTEIRDALLPKLMSGEIRVPVEE